MNNFKIRAFIKILEKKGLITHDEILGEVEVLKKEMEQKIRRMGVGIGIISSFYVIKKN